MSELPIDERDDPEWEQDYDNERTEAAMVAVTAQLSEILLLDQLGTNMDGTEADDAVIKMYKTLKDNTTRADLLHLAISVIYDEAKNGAMAKHQRMRLDLSGRLITRNMELNNSHTEWMD